MAVTLNRVPDTRIFVNSPAGERAWESRACFCFYDAAAIGDSSLTIDKAQASPGSFAFIPANARAPFRALEEAMARAVQPGARYLLWTDAGWAGWRDALVMANGKTVDPLNMWFWDFSALRGSSGAGTLGWHCPAGAAVSFVGTNVVLSAPGMSIVTRVDTMEHSLAVASNTVWLAVDEGPRCGIVSGSLSTADSAEWITLLTPQVRYRWEPDFLGIVKSARLLSDSPADHADVVARFDLHRFEASVDRTQIVLEPAAPACRVLSCVADTTGRALNLTPTDGAAIHFETGGDDAAHASLKGKFRIVPGGMPQPAGTTAPSCEVMPGSAGTEFFQLLSNDGYDGLEFFPGQHAFVEFGTANQAPRLTERSKTAWIAPCRTGPAAAWVTGGFAYVAQPQEHPLYGRRNIASFDQRDTPSTVLFDPAPRTVTACMPFFPFRGIAAGDLDQTRELDLNALAHIRAQVAAKSAAVPLSLLQTLVDSPTTRITTPHGLLVEVDEQNNWHRIILGNSGDGWSLAIPRPEGVQRWALQEALSRPEPFVVVGPQRANRLPSPDEPAVGSIELTARIGGWPMTVKVADATAPGAPLPPSPTPSPAPLPGSVPVLVIKLGMGSLKDMLEDVANWSLARVFNDDPAHVSREAATALNNLDLLRNGQSPLPVPPEQKAISAELKPHYKALYEKITDPNWTGVIIFNGETPLNGVPGHVAVVTQGESMPKAFSVPVMGVDVNRVVPSGRQMELERTSAFGAIHYHSPQPLDERAPGFAFKVRGVNAVFQNTELRVFLATMQLRVAEFFGEKSKQDQPAGKSRVLDIIGRYEGKFDAGGQGQYIFRALGSRSFEFGGDGFLSSLTVTRIDLTSDRVESGTTIESRFAIWGELAFGTKFHAVTGIRKISYENAAIILRDRDFSVDAGNVRVEFDKSGSTDASGLLAKFPFQLSGLRWAPKLQTLDGVGFKHLDLGLQEFQGKKFEFGLELDLNLGSMGKLFEAADFLKARILVGWFIKDGEREFSIGFRFVGGSGPLDIGINGVMRLTAAEVTLKTYDAPSGIGIGLLNPQLEVMGYKVPSEPKDTLVAFLPSGKDNIAWAWARPETNVGPLKLDYFAIGQRINLVPSGSFGPGASLKAVIDASVKQMRPIVDEFGKAKLPDIGPLYTPDAGWGVVARGSVSAFKFRFVFMDGIDRYGLGVDMPNIANVDVLYRKLADGVGIFSAEIEPQFRSLEMGAATVTLPIVNFDALTNGGWSINIGYHGNDFSRGTTVQVLPFIGSGGIRFGRLDWRSSYVLNSPESTRRELIRVLDLNPVIEMSLAVRVGIGKEIREGVFSAGVTLSVYGIFEGAIGTPRDLRFPADRSRRYLKIYGAAGILLEIFGSVNFAIVSAAVSVRVWVETGITFETWAPVIVHAEAGVSVYVRFVIARFSVFGHTIEIAIDFSFSTRVRFTQQIAESFDGSLPDIYKPYAGQSAAPLSLLALQAHEAATPLRWELHRVSPTPATQSCAVTLEPMVSDGKPVLLPLLVASGGDSPGIANFAVSLYKWALRLSLGLAPTAPDPQKVRRSHLHALTARLDLPRAMTLSRWGDEPLDFAHLQPFIEAHLRLQLRSVGDLRAEQGAAVASGTLLPWFADLAIFGTADKEAEVALRDFRGADATPVDDAWERALYEALAQSRPQYPVSGPQQLNLAMFEAGLVAFQAGNKNALDAVVEDWAGALVHGMAQRAVQAGDALCRDSKDPDCEIDLVTLIAALTTSAGEGIPAAQVAQHASTFLHHGLRVPLADGAPGSQPLPQLLKTEILLQHLVAGGKRWAFSVRALSSFGGTWISGASDVGPFDAEAALSTLNSLYAGLGNNKLRLEARFEDDVASTSRARRFSVPPGVAAAPRGLTVATLRLMPIPRALAGLVRRKGTQAVTTALHDPDPQRGDPPKPCPQRWFARVELRLGSPRTGTGSAHPVLNVDQRIRDLLIAMNDAQGVTAVRAWLVHGADEAEPAVPLRLVDGDEAFLFVSNFSPEPAPAMLGPLAMAAPEPPAYSSLATPDKLAQVLWMSATVNSPGFELAFKQGNPIAHLFKDSAVASVDIVFELSSPARLHPVVDGLLVDAADADRIPVVETTHILELVSTTPDGQVAIEVRRKNPSYGAAATSAAQDFAALAARYELADYAMKNGAMARENVVPVRVHMDDESRQAVKANEPEWWTHRLLVPLSRIAGGSPYEFVGTDLKDLVVPGLRDGAGHYLDDSRIDFAWLGNTKILYRDAIPQLQEMPGVSATWQLERTGTGPRAVVALLWSAAELFADKDTRDHRRTALLAQYSRWLAMSAMGDFTAMADLNFGGQPAATEDIKHRLQQWLAAVLKQLSDATDKDCECAPIAIAVASASWPVATPVPCAMDVTVTFRRDDTLCDKRTFDSDIWLARSSVVPARLQSAADWRDWAGNVGKVFSGSFTLLRRQQAHATSKGDRAEVPVINLIRRNMLEPGTPKADSASFHAPTPLAKTLRSGTVAVAQPDGQTEQVEVADIDLNAVAVRAANALEAVLDPRASTALCRETPELYSRLALSKRNIADGIASRLTTILDQGPDAGKDAKTKFRDASRANVRMAFAPVALVEVHLSAPKIEAPKTFLWGQIEVRDLDAKRRAALSFSPVRVPLGRAGIEGSFDFVVGWADPGSEPVAAVEGPMAFRPRFVEVQGDRDLGGYRPSDWYEVLWTGELGDANEFFIAPPSEATWTIPLPLRLIPPTPAILRHAFESGDLGKAANLDDYIRQARTWSYVLAAMVPGSIHDTTEVTVRFDDSPMLRPFSVDLLFQALVAFSRHEQLVATVTGQFIAGVRPDGKDVALLVRLFESFAAALASAPLMPTTVNVAGHTRTVTLGKQIKGSTTTLRWRVIPNEVQRTVSATLLHMTAENAGEASEPIMPDTSDTLAGTALYKHQPAVDLALAGVAGLSPRQVRLSGLDVMLQGSALPRVMSRRNEELLGTGAAIAPAFVFETPAVEAPAPLIPHLVQSSAFDISSGAAGAKPLADWLAAVRDALLRNANEAKFTLDISARFRLPLAGTGESAIEFYVPLPSLKELKPSAGNDWAATLAGYLYPPLLRLDPATRTRGTLELKVQVFHAGSNGAKWPALSLQKLELPLTTVSLQPALPAAAVVIASSPGAAVPMWRVAAYVHERMHGLSGDATQLERARREWARFALGGPVDRLAAFNAPRLAALDTPATAREWALCSVAAAQAIADGQAATYALLEWAPAAGGGATPATTEVPWIMTALVDRVVQVAGPLQRREGEQDLFLWGIPWT